MAHDELYEHIFKRRSIRKFSAEPMDEKTLSVLNSFLDEVDPLFPKIKTKIKLIDASETKGMFRTDAPNFIAFFSEQKEGYLANAGFMLQQIDLFLSSIGLGNCYQAMAKLGKGVDDIPGLELVMLMSFGRPAEELHRKGISEFKRRSLESISTVKGMDEIMEAARLAPSAVNKQTWFFRGGDGVIDAFAERSIISNKTNQINVGIALCHIWLAAEHAGMAVKFRIDKEAQKDAPMGYSYIATARMK